MILLNLGCGSTRPPAPWINVDTIMAQHGFWSVECDQLRAETNYAEMDFVHTPWPHQWGFEAVEGILLSHVLEHLDCITARKVLRQCFAALRPGGVLRVSVPNAAYFKEVYVEDNRANCKRLFGENEAIHDPQKSTFMDYALFFEGHVQILDATSVWCHLANAGFTPDAIYEVGPFLSARQTEATELIPRLDNRLPFSLFMEAYK